MDNPEDRDPWWNGWRAGLYACEVRMPSEKEFAYWIEGFRIGCEADGARRSCKWRLYMYVFSEIVAAYIAVADFVL